MHVYFKRSMKKYNLYLFAATVIVFANLMMSCEPGVLLTELSPHVDSFSHEEAGKLINRDLFLTNGNIPLVLIMANKPDGVSELQSRTVYRDYYSSRWTYNAQEYLYEVSNGAFTFEFQGIWGPYDIPEDSTGSIAEITAASLKQAADDRLNLSQFDKDRDGVIRQDELLIMIVDNGSLYGGVASWFNAEVRGTRVRMMTGIHGSHANLATIVHEITHLIGTVDIYGSNCNSLNLSLMSCTVGINGYPIPVPSIVNNGWDASIWTFGSRRDAEWEYAPHRGLNMDYNLITPESAPSGFERSSWLWGPGEVTPRFQDGLEAGFVLEVGQFDLTSHEVEVCVESSSPLVIDADAGR
jgi:hypothetical protein